MSRGLSRRGLFGTAGAAALAAGTGVVSAGILGGDAQADDATADKVHPFEGAHQQGIVTPQQRSASYIALDVTAANAKELQQLLRTITSHLRFLTAGGTPPDNGMQGTTEDNGVLGGPAEIPADGLTGTLSVGASLFDGRYGLAGKRPKRLIPMPAFPDDSLQPAWCHGDLMLQLCADNQDTVVRAMRDILRATRGAMQPRWRMDGFISPPRPAGTPRNLLGFKDGTANTAITPDTYDDLVWTHAGGGEPAWVEGGSYHVVRLIRMLVEFWDRVSVREQNTIIGREKYSGAPLTGSEELDAPDYSGGLGSEAIGMNAHIRLASDSGRATTQRMLRRGYNYDAGIDTNGNVDQGLIFTTFNQDLDRQFAGVQARLAGEPLADYIAPFGGGYFFALPGVQGGSDWLGRGMFA